MNRRLQSLKSKSYQKLPPSSRHQNDDKRQVNHHILTQRPITNQYRTSELIKKKSILDNDKISYIHMKEQYKNNKISHHRQLIIIPKLQNPESYQYLNYSNNKIVSIPKYLAEFINLRDLNLSHNEIVKIDIICTLQNLQKVNLSYNCINQIPKDIHKLLKLEYFDLSFNKIWYLSQIISIKKLFNRKLVESKKLIQINLNGNSLIKTNPKTVQNLIKFNTQKQQENNFQINDNFPLYDHAHKFNPNIQEHNKENIDKHNLQQRCEQLKVVSKNYRQNKSINQSLIDISAIICSIPANTDKEQKQCDNEKIFKQLTLKVNEKQNFTKNQKDLSTNKKSDTLLFSEMKLEENQILSPNNAKKGSVGLLLKNQKNFEEYLKNAEIYNNELKSILNKIQIICQFNGEIPQNFKKNFIEINQLTIQKIRLTMKILEPFSEFKEDNQIYQNIHYIKECEQKINQIQGFGQNIKLVHEKFIKCFMSQEGLTDIQWYEVWVNQYKKLTKIHALFIILMNKLFQLFKRVMMIKKVIFMDSNQNHFKSKHIQKDLFHKQKCETEKQLKNLLFSQSKQKEILYSSSKKSNSKYMSQKNSMKKQRNSEHKKNSENCLFIQSYCLECPIKMRQIEILKQKLIQNERKLANMNEQIMIKQNLIKDYEQIKNMNVKLDEHQSNIIEELKGIRPSTYQNILLQQARAIQELVIHQDFIFFDSKASRQKDSPNLKVWLQNTKIKNLSKRRQELTNQTISKGLYNSEKDENKIILNQFVLETRQLRAEKNVLESHSRIYFKSNGHSKSTNTKSNKSVHNFPLRLLTSESNESAKKLNEIDLQQKNSHSNPLKHSIGKNKPKDEQKLNMHQILEDQVQYQINQFKLSKVDNKKNGISPEIKNLTDGNHILSISRFQTQNSIKKTKKNSSEIKRSAIILRSQSLKSIYSKGYDYEDLRLQQGKQYKKYIEYHLRNNIKQILQKRKSNQKIKRKSILNSNLIESIQTIPFKV